MEISLAAYIQQMELIAFFAGYPLVFILIQVLANARNKPTPLMNRLKQLLPLAYALTGTLYFGLTVKNILATYSFSNNFQLPENPWLAVWALLSLLMWFKLFRRYPIVGLLHSLVFFFLFAKEIYFYAVAQSGKERVLIDMKLYTDSLLINAACLLATYLFYALWQRFFVRKPSTPGR